MSVLENQKKNGKRERERETMKEREEQQKEIKYINDFSIKKKTLMIKLNYTFAPLFSLSQKAKTWIFMSKEKCASC